LYLDEMAALDPDTRPFVGVTDPDPVRRAFVADKYPAAAVTDDTDAFLNRDEVSLVAICASTDQAPEIARRALAAGKHVVSVKPAARSLDELDEVIQAARDAGRFFGSFEGLMRLAPRLQLCRELVRSGAVGQPQAFHQVAHGGMPAPWPGQTGPSWWLDGARVPGGAWIDHAIYAVDQARFVFGGEIDRVQGVIENRVHRELSVEDYGAALLRLRPDNGGPSVSLFFEDTWTAEPGVGGAHRQEIIGTRGTLRPEGGDWVVRNGGEETRRPIPAAATGAMPTLLAMLRANETPPFGASDARANLATCLAVYESARG
jgi:predicted dehydrogenase